MRRMMQGVVLFLAFAAAPPVVAQSMPYELFPVPDVEGTASYRTANAYVVVRKEDQFWVCSVRYNYRDLAANNGGCVKLDAIVGRPSLNAKDVAHAVTGSATINPFLPVIWFIDPGSGDVQVCDIRHAGNA